MVVRGMILAHSFPIVQTQAQVTINQDMKALTPFKAWFLSFLALICKGMKPEMLGLIERSIHGIRKLESAKFFGLSIPLPPSRTSPHRHLRPNPASPVRRPAPAPVRKPGGAGAAGRGAGVAVERLISQLASSPKGGRRKMGATENMLKAPLPLVQLSPAAIEKTAKITSLRQPGVWP